MANHPAGQVCPALQELLATLRSIPDFNGVELGTIRNDGSRHTAGLAVDIMLDSHDSSQKNKAERLIFALVHIHSRIKWYDLIYTDFHIPGSPLYAGKLLTRNRVNPSLAAAHANHIHLDWCDYTLRIKPKEKILVYEWPAAARTSGFGGMLKGVYMFGF